MVGEVAHGQRRRAVRGEHRDAAVGHRSASAGGGQTSTSVASSSSSTQGAVPGDEHSPVGHVHEAEWARSMTAGDDPDGLPWPLDSVRELAQA